MAARRLDQLTWPEAGDSAEGAVLAIPLGTTEQHGPHLPLSTDTDIAVALCLRLAARRSDVVVAPPLPYGASGEHAGFPGTLSIGQAALEAVVVELARSATDTYAHVLFVNGHGGNAAPLARALTTLTSEQRDVHVFHPRWNGDAHAGHSETSMLLALDPDRIRGDRVERGNTRALGELMPTLIASGVAAVAPSGILGDPTTATAEDGNLILDLLVGQLCAEVQTWVGAPR